MKEIIEKAIKGGFPKQEGQYYIDFLPIRPHAITAAIFTDLVFSHPFLKAYFGEDAVCSECGNSQMGCLCPEEEAKYSLEKWQYHGIQMFLAEDRREYLGRFL